LIRDANPPSWNPEPVRATGSDDRMRAERNERGSGDPLSREFISNREAARERDDETGDRETY
jgi:hypothetical protein